MEKLNQYSIFTAINYMNGSPHMGHGYEIIIADILNRYHKLTGKETYFTTGSDEHGQKIEKKAKENNQTPIELCEINIKKFKMLNKLLNIEEDYYVRTSSNEHKETVNYVYNKILEKGDIYEGTYKGWYNEREETYITEVEAQRNGYSDIITGKKLEKKEEPSIFFRLSRYQERIIEHIKENENFILPKTLREEILKRLETPLENLSISRTNLKWGIKVPNNSEHVFYVWFDALINYLTVCEWPLGKKNKYWPVNVHLIGKDIIWFHSVIWPSILMSLEIPLPKSIVAHGFILKDNEKMSKSIGNIIDPMELIKRVPIEGIRYYLASSSIHSDVGFSEEKLKVMYNSEMKDLWGNLVHRGLNLTKICCKGKIPTVNEKLMGIFNINEALDEIEENYSKFTIHISLQKIIKLTKEVNEYITKKEPWSKKHEEEDKNKMIRNILEGIYILAHLYSPILSKSSEEVYRKLNTLPVTLDKLKEKAWNILEDGKIVNVGNILFEKMV